MRKGLMVILALALLGGADGLHADDLHAHASADLSPSPSKTHRERESADLFPLELEAYASNGEACGPREPLASSWDGTLASSAVEQGPRALLSDGEAGASAGKRYLPVLLSLLVPGTGEIYMGYYVRGAVLVAAEITAWTGWAYYHNKGLDSRAEYEAFADAYWSYGKWVDDHALWRDPEYVAVQRTFTALDSIGREYWHGWPPYHTWHSKEEEKQNYYENIGKYDWFISGWADWDPTTQPRESDQRTTYRAMRKKSNDELDKATGFIYVSVAARVISLVETLILSRRDGDDPAGDTPSGSFSIKTRATGLASGEVALVYRFR